LVFHLAAVDSGFGLALADIVILEGISNSKLKIKSGKWKCLAKTLGRFNVHLPLASLSSWMIVGNVLKD
jgi:hypothetical protein